MRVRAQHPCITVVGGPVAPVSLPPPSPAPSLPAQLVQLPVQLPLQLGPPGGVQAALSGPAARVQHTLPADPLPGVHTRLLPAAVDLWDTAVRG